MPLVFVKPCLYRVDFFPRTLYAGAEFACEEITNYPKRIIVMHDNLENT